MRFISANVSVTIRSRVRKHRHIPSGNTMRPCSHSCGASGSVQSSYLHPFSFVRKSYHTCLPQEFMPAVCGSQNVTKLPFKKLFPRNERGVKTKRHLTTRPRHHILVTQAFWYRVAVGSTTRNTCAISAHSYTGYPNAQMSS